MKRKIRLLAWFVAILTGSAFVIGATYMYSVRFDRVYTEAPPRIDTVLADLITEREAVTAVDPATYFGSDSEVNILLLGLDSRKGNKSPHCDAIHMMTLNLEDWTIRMTSVPRGTYSYIPPGNYPTTEYYLANACSYVDLDYGIAQIEKVVGVKADYYATVGFSQVLGIMRVFDLPTTSTLQWLRHRQSYAIGDPQRSHNQAVFIKDMILNEADRFRDDSSKALFYVLYNLVDTDMDFQTVRALAQGFLNAKIDERPDDISLFMKPYYNTADYHLDLENADEQVQSLLHLLQGRLSSDDLSNHPLADVQNELAAYLEDVRENGSEDEVDRVFTQRLWLQVEDHDTRETLQYEFVEDRVYAYREADRLDDAEALLTEYIIEKQTTGENVYAKRGEGLLHFVLQ